MNNTKTDGVIIGTPAELCDKFMYALAFNKGKVQFDEISEFITENLGFEKSSLIEDELYLNFLVLTLVSNENVVIKNEKREIVADKMKFVNDYDISSFMNPTNINQDYKQYTFELTDEKLFEIVTGDKLAARNTLGEKSFELLLEIASHTKKGIDRITLCKLCNQDPRSLPSRMKKLEKYIISVNCLKQSRVTQHMWHKDFAENVRKEFDPLNTRTIERMAIIEKIKAAHEGIREVSDLKEELGVSPNHKEAKVFRKNYFWLDKYNYLERILIKSAHNGRIFYCLKFLKDYLPEELSVEENDDIDDDEAIFSDIIKTSKEKDTSASPFFETSVLDSLAENSEAMFSNSIFNNEVVLRSIVNKSGVDGTASMDILNGLFSSDFIKPFHKFMVQMVKDPVESTSALENSPSQLVKVYDFEGKVKHYRIFSHQGYETKYGVKESKIKAVEVTDLDVCPISQRAIADQIKQIPLPKLLEVVEYGNSHSEYYWIADLSPSNKKRIELLNPNGMTNVSKKQKNAIDIKSSTKIASNEKENLNHKVINKQPLKKIKIEKIDEIKSAKSSRLQNLSSVRNNTSETRSFGDFVGYSIRSVKTQQAILELIRENNGLLCYFDKQITEELRTKMNVSYLIDKKVLKRDIINLLEVKKIKTFRLDDQLYLTSPAVSSEQVQFFHKNKLQSVKDNIGLTDRLASSNRNIENLRETNNIDPDDISKNKHLINNGFITPGIKCIVKPSLYFANKSRQVKFERSNIKPEAVPKASKTKVKKHKRSKSATTKDKKLRKRLIRQESAVKVPESSFSHPLMGHIDDQLNEIAEQNLNLNKIDGQIKDKEKSNNATDTHVESHLEKEVFKTNIVLFIKCCLVSKLLEKSINWEVIGKLFRRSSKKVKEIFTNELLKHKDDSWLTHELNNCRYHIGENIKTKKLDLIDIENVEYVKIAKVWLESEYEVSQSGLKLIEDVKEFKKLFATESKPSSTANLYFSEKSYFKTSLVKRYKGLLRKKYSKKIIKENKNTFNYTAIKSAMKSVLLDQKGKNNKHSKVNVDIFSDYIQKYSQDELNSVLKELSQKKILLMNNSGIQLNDLVLDSFVKLDQTSFFQGFRKNANLIEGFLSEKKTPIFEDEMQMELSGYIFDRCDVDALELINLSGKYKADMKKDTSYSIKDEETLNSQMLILSRNLNNLANKPLALLRDVPGLGIPYSNLWIDGNGDIRQAIWKICISHVCLYLYMRPESTVEALSLSFKEFLDIAEIKMVIEWLKQNGIFKTNENTKSDTIDLVLASMLF